MAPIASPLRLRWNGHHRAVAPGHVVASEAPFHDSLALYQSLLAQPQCQRVELVRVHCFCRNQMILGLQVVYASYFDDNRCVVETASPRLVFPEISTEIERHTWEVDEGDSLQAVQTHGVSPFPDQPEYDIIKAVTFQTQQGHETTLGASPMTTSPSYVATRQTNNRVVALVATVDPESGVINQIGYYSTTDREKGLFSNEQQVPKDLILHKSCGKKHPKIRQVTLDSTHSSSQIIASQLTSSRQHSLNSSKRKISQGNPWFSDLAFYQRLCSSPQITRVKLNKVCLYYNSHSILRLYGVYQCWLRDGSTFESVPIEHAEWKQSIENGNSHNDIRVFTVTLQAGEYISDIYTQKHHNSTNTVGSSPGSFKVITLVTNRRSIHLEAQLMKETRTEESATNCNYDRKVVALAGSIQQLGGSLRQIAYVTQPTNWQVLKPWILSWHSSERPTSLALSDRTNNQQQLYGSIPRLLRHKKRQRRELPAIPKRWLLVKALVGITKQPQLQPSSKGSSTATEQEMLLHQLLQDMHQDAFRHILSYLAPTPRV